jgi:enoyl-CoA hydratase/carnithine racemase
MTIYAEGALQLDIDGALATLTLNRPAARNALNVAMWRALPEVIEAVGCNAAIRVLIVRGAGENFASGADIGEFPTVFAGRDAAHHYARLLEAATGAIAALEKPVIAEIEGYCIGAGLAIALACDLRIAASDARFGAPPAKLGLVYSLGDTLRLVRAVGASAAKAILFTGALHSADAALGLGLLNEIHPPERVKAAVRERADAIASLSAHSIRRAKAMVALIEQGVVEETETTRAWFVDAALGEDFAEGLAAFQEKRRPIFK